MKEIRTQFDLSDYLQRNVDGTHFTGVEKLVLLAIAVHVNPDNNWEGWPSLDTLQRLCCATRPTVTKAIKQLVEKGVMEYKKGKTNVSNRYKINLPKLSTIVEEKASYVKGAGIHNTKNLEKFYEEPF